MKKTYMIPTTDVIEVEMQHMLAFSGDASNPGSGDAGGAAGRYDDDEW
ncbi:MAG: hypothetical protein IJV17_05705 [Prevotella sp.]|nr:hypothetical protein [Prevotella sp.]